MLSVQNISNFEKARGRASQLRWINLLRRRPNNLLSFESVRKALGAYNSVPRGVRDVPLDQVVGSVGRTREFNRSFWPVNDVTEKRWRQVDELYFTRGFGPISVYQIGEVFFVEDGNHRVSVSRAHGVSTIEAYVTELKSPVPVYRTDRLEDIVRRKEEYDQSRQRPRRQTTGSLSVVKGYC
jgi:hypothetical protein